MTTVVVRQVRGVSGTEGRAGRRPTLRATGAAALARAGRSAGRFLASVAVALACLLAGDGAALAATITVDVAYDESAPWPSVPGRCSFHDAIKAANGDAAVQGCPAGSGTDTIRFNIAVGGADPIDVTGLVPLPTITAPVSIDGFSQPGAHANGRAVGNDAVWRIVVEQLNVEADGCTIQGLWVGNAIGQSRGLQVNGDRNTVRGNLLYWNSGRGLMLIGSENLIGGTEPAARNIIAANDPLGADLEVSSYIAGDRNRVQGNYFGTDPTGTTAVGAGDGTAGLLVSGAGNVIGGTAPGAGNVFVGHQLFDLSLAWWWWFPPANPQIRENRVEGNWIGLLPNGTSPGQGIVQVWGAPDNVIGGTAPGAGNVIAGTVTVFGSAARGTRVEGNTVGLAPDGRTRVGGGVVLDGTAGVVVGGTAPAARNVIAGGVVVGKTLSADAPSGNAIVGNFIGTDTTGTVDAGGDGVRIMLGTGTTVGGTDPGAGNLIRASTGDGIAILGGNGHAILGNAIAGNDGLGIDLGDDGVTANDPGDGDDGPNRRQNAPVLAGATTNGTAVSLAATLQSAPNRPYRVEAFASAACDGSGHGEGATFLRAATFTTDGSGNAAIGLDLAGVAEGQSITATATDTATNDSSEFSNCVAVRRIGANVSPASGPTTERGGTATFTVALTAAPSADVRIPLSVSDATEATVAPDSLRFTPATWNVAQAVTATGVDDSVDDGDVPYLVVLGAATSDDPTFDRLDPPDVSLVNADDDAGGLLQFAPAAVSVAEGAGTAVLTLTRADGAAGGVTVEVATADGSARAGGDYTAVATTVTFGPGETSKPVSVPILDDGAVEATESFTVTLRSPTGGAALGPAASATVTIADDDARACAPRPPVLVSAVPEGNQLRVRVQTQTSPTTTVNTLGGVTFTRLDNAVVTAGGQAVPTGTPMLMASGAQQFEFTVRRAQPGQPTTVHFVVRDGCGDWPTFVGGGRDAGF